MDGCRNRIVRQLLGQHCIDQVHCVWDAMRPSYDTTERDVLIQTNDNRVRLSLACFIGLTGRKSICIGYLCMKQVLQEHQTNLSEPRHGIQTNKPLRFLQEHVLELL